jgi:hypothetical protein
MKTPYGFEIQAIQKQNIILKDNLHKIHRISKGNGTNRVRLQTRARLGASDSRSAAYQRVVYTLGGVFNTIELT